MMQIYHGHLGFQTDSFYRLYIRDKRGEDLAVLINSARDRGDQDGLSACLAHLLDEAAQVIPILGFWIRGAVAFSRLVIVTELDDHIVSLFRNDLVPEADAAKALRAGTATSVIDDLCLRNELAQIMSPARLHRAVFLGIGQSGYCGVTCENDGRAMRLNAKGTEAKGKDQDQETHNRKEYDLDNVGSSTLSRSHPWYFSHMKSSLSILAATLFTVPAFSLDTKLVRQSEALSPEQEQAALHVPEGFEVQLFASEPMIDKPINMAFDARGRLWVSSTVEYPYSADKSRWADAQGTSVKGSRDAIKILEDTDGDGKADKVTDFADGLNIPTGVVPWHKPEHKAGCIAWSIPNIWYFADTDGDGKADLREVIFGPLGYEKDTHGMCSSFRLGLDGWIYATHGFNNTSLIKAKDGSTLKLHSGNVFRFRPDGSRVEPWTHGQVNPFGLCWDSYGNLYSADCHSSPIYQLIRGAHYPSFGKPDGGLGFAPVMCQHTHGSTGICGITYLDSGVWGPEWDDHMFIGNVVTSRVNHDHVTFIGTTPKANEKPDFITSDDPWFRPVDIQLGPDHALYIADFYNRIIGHYEVPLDHPGRDRERGRIWRVVKKGTSTNLAEANLIALDNKKLVQQMGSPNITRRMSALQVAVHKLSDLPKNELRQLLSEHCQTPLQKATATWLTFQLARGGPERVSFLDDNMDDFVDVHLLSQEAQGPIQTWKMALIYTSACLWSQERPPVPRTQLAAAWALTRSRVENRGAAALLLIGVHGLTSADDETLRHTILLAAKDLLQDPNAFREFTKGLDNSEEDPSEPKELAAAFAAMPATFRQIALTLNTEQSAEWFLKELKKAETRPVDLLPLLTHIARCGSVEVTTEAILEARRLTEKDTAAQAQVIEAIYHGLSEGGRPSNKELLTWAQQMANELLDQKTQNSVMSWEPLAQKGESPAWGLVKRACADGTETLVLQSMTQGGQEESRTGTLTSKAFEAPAKLSFWINGHRGPTSGPPHNKNLVRLVSAKSSTVLAQAYPPRRDSCVLVEWDLSAHVGESVRLEIVDGDDHNAYAWLGLARIEPAVVSVLDFAPEQEREASLRQLASMLGQTAPVALRERLSPYLPARPAPAPLPVTAEQRQQLDALITTRTAAFDAKKVDLERGQKNFMMHCAACHQMQGQGGLIGPQLDGIGNRGVARLSEDILDPNRNVDAHFHLHTLKLKDGSSISGFLKGEAGQVILISDAAGQEHRIAKSEVTEDLTTAMSLMPPAFGQMLSAEDYNHLMGWLLTK